MFIKRKAAYEKQSEIMPAEKEKFGIYKIYKKETDIWREGFVKQVDINENVEYNEK